MSFKAAVDAIRAKITNPGGFSAVPVGFVNENFQPPDGAPWVLVSIEGGDNHVHTAGSPGNRLFLHAGIIWAHVFVPMGSGDALARTYADQIGALLQRIDIPAPSLPQIVRTEDASQGAGEPVDEKGKWWRVSVNIPFNFFSFA